MCELFLLYLGVELQPELLQLDGVRGLETLSVLLQGGQQTLPLDGLLEDTRCQSKNTHTVLFVLYMYVHVTFEFFICIEVKTKQTSDIQQLIKILFK